MIFLTGFYISTSYSSVVTGSAAAEFSVRAVPGFLKQLGHDTRFVLNASFLKMFSMSNISITSGVMQPNGCPGRSVCNDGHSISGRTNCSPKVKKNN